MRLGDGVEVTRCVFHLTLRTVTYGSRSGTVSGNQLCGGFVMERLNGMGDIAVTGGLQTGFGWSIQTGFGWSIQTGFGWS